MSAIDAVVWFSIFDWWNSSHGHSDFRLACELARRRPVLFVNSIGMRMPMPGRTERVGRRVLRKLRSALHGLARPDPERPDLAVVTLMTPPSAAWFTPMAQRWSEVQVRLSLARLGWRAHGAIVTVPTAGPIARRFCGDRLIYYRSDKHGAFEEVSSEALRAESDLLDNAPIVAYAARHLMVEEAVRVGNRARYLEHAVDPRLFNPGVEPDAACFTQPSPRLGFFGSLRGHGIDFDLLRETAEALPDASVLVMGDRLDHASALRGRENIRIMPPRPYHAMPGAWAALDVALMPYRMTEWTCATDPIKLREILAMGIPIAAMPLPAVLPYRNTIFIAKDRQGFINAVCGAIAAERRPFKYLPDWAGQARKLENWLTSI